MSKELLEYYIKEIQQKNTSLTSIDLSGCDLYDEDITRLMDALSCNPKVANRIKDLNLNKNNITYLDASPLKNLELLRVSMNRLSNIKLTNLVYLQSLYADGNELSEIDFHGLKNLTILYINSNKFDYINLSDLSTLVELNVSHNNFKNISFPELKKLEKINIINNVLEELDVSKVIFLEELHASRNNLTKIDLSNIEYLQVIDFSKNPLHEIDISGLRNLSNINLTETNVSMVSKVLMHIAHPFAVFHEPLANQLNNQMFLEHFKSMRPKFLRVIISLDFTVPVTLFLYSFNKHQVQQAPKELLDIFVENLQANPLNALNEHVKFLQDAFASSENHLASLKEFLASEDMQTWVNNLRWGAKLAYLEAYDKLSENLQKLHQLKHDHPEMCYAYKNLKTSYVDQIWNMPSSVIRRLKSTLSLN